MQQRHLAAITQIEHDLRTPIGTMATAIDLVADERTDRALRAEALDVLRRQVLRLGSLVEQLGALRLEIEKR